MVAPRRRRRCSVSDALAMLLISDPSVISSSSNDAATSKRAQVARSSAANEWSASSDGGRLIAIRICGLPAAARCCSARQASVSTKGVSRALLPLRLDQRQEFTRTDHAMFRMAPADQRFQADDVVAFEIDLTLIPDLKLPFVEACGNGKLELPAAAIVALKRFVEHRDRAGRLALGMVERDVGERRQVRKLGISGTAHGKADAGTRHDLLVVKSDRLGNRIQQVARKSLRGLLVADLGSNDDEFIAAEPSYPILRFDRTTKALGNVHQELVARVMAKGVVDALEVVEIDEAECDQRVR